MTQVTPFDLVLQLQIELFVESNRTKFEVSSFSRCKDNEKFAKLKKVGHVF